MTVRINCDMGEAYSIYKCGDDEAIMPFVDLANVACGFHASDPVVMRSTVCLAKEHGVAVGAHPSYPDREGFGRREMKLSYDELVNCLIYQVGALKAFLDIEGMALSHIKPHGALNGVAWHDEESANAIAEVACAFGVPVLGMSGTLHETAYTKAGAEVIWETYVDLEYNDENEVIITRKHDPVTPEAAVAQALLAAKEGKVKTVSGGTVPVRCETICVHSDTPGAVEVAKAVRAAVVD